MSIEKMQYGLDKNAQWNTVRAQKLNDFYRSLDELQVSLNNILREIPVGNTDLLKCVLEDFEAKLRIKQREFLQQLAMNQELADTSGVQAQCVWGGTEAALGTVAAVGTYSLLQAATVTSSSWIFWTNNTSLGAAIAGSVGVSTAVATGGITLVVGSGVLAVSHYFCKGRRWKKTLVEIKNTYRSAIRPRLEQWARDVVESYQPEIFWEA